MRLLLLVAEWVFQQNTLVYDSLKFVLNASGDVNVLSPPG